MSSREGAEVLLLLLLGDAALGAAGAVAGGVVVEGAFVAGYGYLISVFIPK